MTYWCDKGHFNKDQAEFFSKLIKEHNPKYVLETGFCTGRSASVILENSKELEKMISIDINFDYMRPEGRQVRKILTDVFKNFHTIEASSRIILNDTFFKQEYPKGIDWFTVDGDHSYNGCLMDMEAAYKYINKGGIIIVDDYKSGHPNGCSIPAVTKACDEFAKRHPNIRRNVWNNKGKGFCVFLF